MDQNKIFINQDQAVRLSSHLPALRIFLCKCYAGAELKCCQFEIKNITEYYRILQNITEYYK